MKDTYERLAKAMDGGFQSDLLVLKGGVRALWAAFAAKFQSDLLVLKGGYVQAVSWPALFQSDLLVLKDEYGNPVDMSGIQDFNQTYWY